MSQLPEIFNQTTAGKAYPEQIRQAFNSIRDLVNAGIETDNIKDGSVIDSKIGNRTIDDTTALADVGTITVLLGALARAIKDIKGAPDWKDIPTISLTFLNDQKADVGHTHGLNPDGHTHNEFPALDMFGVARINLTNCTVTRDAGGKIAQISYVVNGGETGTYLTHRNATGRVNSIRYSNSLGTQIQLDYVRDTSGRITSFQRSVFNNLIADGDSW